MVQGAVRGVVMEFSLDSLDGFPEDSDVLETSEGHVIDSPTEKTSPRACVKSKDIENAVISNQECHDLDTFPKTKEREGRIDKIENQRVLYYDEFKKVPESKISLKKYQETSSDFTKTESERSPSSTYSTPKIADLVIISKKCPDHRQCGLKLTSNCASSKSSSVDQREDLPELATPTRGDNFVGVDSHHHDLSPWERWVVQKARQERERREGKRLSDVSGQFV